MEEKEVTQPVWIECPECGNQQEDMGRGVSCDECGFGPMPPPDDDALETPKEGT